MAQEEPRPNESQESPGDVYHLSGDFRGANINIKSTIQGTELRRSATVPFMAPDMPGDFVPRPDEFEQIVAYLLDNEGEEAVALTAALRGAGGYGKTTLAAAVCHDQRVRATYPDGILWINLGEKPKNLAGLVEDLIYVLTGARPGYVDLNAAAAGLAEALSERRCLLVVDDVWNAADLRPFLRGGRHCTRLVTTRNKDTLPDDTRQVDVDAMRQREAVALLGANLPGVEKEGAALGLLAARLGEWPLLLKIVNRALLRRSPQLLRQAIQYVNSALDRRGLIAFDPRDATERHQAISRTIGVSLELLTDEEQERYAELAVFPEDVEVPLDIVYQLWRIRGQLDEFETEELCEHLHQLSLLLHFDLQSQTIRLHDVIRAYLVYQLGSQIVEVHEQLLTFIHPWHAEAGLYAWRYLPYHLKEAGYVDMLCDLLFSFRWLQEKLEQTEANALVADFDYLPGDSDLRLLQTAIRQAAHILARDKRQLAGQLLGRLLAQESAAIQALLQQAGEQAPRPWLRPLRASLPAPDEPLVRTMEGHTDVVTAVAVTPDGQLAVSASEDSTLKVWDLNSGQLVRTLQGHTIWINNVAITADGQCAISASDDRTLKVWDLNSGRLLNTLQGHTSMVKSVAITTGGQYAISASGDQTLIVWELSGGRLLLTFQGHTDVVNAVAVTPDRQCAVSASRDNTLKAWNLNSGRLLYTLKGHTRWVTGVAVTPDGQRAVSASWDYSLKMWDLKSGQLLRTMKGHTGPVSSVAVTPDGKHAVSASWDRNLKVWDLNGGQHSHSVEGHTDRITSVAVAAKGQRSLSASYDKTLKVWDLGSGRLLHTLKGHSGVVSGVAVTPDGQRAVSASEDKSLKIWDLNSGRLLHSLEGHTRWVNGVAITPDGQNTVSASSDYYLKVWDLNSGRLLRTLEGHTDEVRGVDVTLNGQYAVSASNDKTLKVWDLNSDGLLRTLEGHSDAVRGVAVTPDGQRAVSASEDKTLKVWDLNSGRLLRTLEGHADGVSGVAVTPDGQYAVSASEDKTLKVWRLSGGEIVATFFVDDSLRACAVAPEGQIIVCGGSLGRLHWLRLEE